jgi:hypothetical protein
MKKQRSGEDYITRSFMLGVPQNYNLGDKIENIEIGGECSTYGGE